MPNGNKRCQLEDGIELMPGKSKGKAGKGKRCCFVRLVAWCFHGWLLNRVVPAQAAPSTNSRSRSRSWGHTGCSPLLAHFPPPSTIVRAAAADAGCQKLMLTRRFPFDLVTRLPQRARPALLLRRNQWQKALQISLFDLRFFSFLPPISFSCSVVSFVWVLKCCSHFLWHLSPTIDSALDKYVYVPVCVCRECEKLKNNDK